MADFAAFGAQALDSPPGTGGSSVSPSDKSLTLKPKSYFGYAEIQEQAYRTVIAMDFGTTYSGVAYSFANSDWDEVLTPAFQPRESIWRALPASGAHYRRTKLFCWPCKLETIEIFRTMRSKFQVPLEQAKKDYLSYQPLGSQRHRSPPWAIRDETKNRSICPWHTQMIALGNS